MTSSTKNNITAMTKILDKIIERREQDFYQLHENDAHSSISPILVDYAMMTASEFATIYDTDHAIISQKDWNYNTILHYAAKLGNYELVEYLLEKNDSVDVKNTEGKTPLNFAVKEDHIEIVRLLLKTGANPDEAGYYESILKHAKSNEIKNLLIEHGCIEPIDFSEKNLEALVLAIEQSDKLHIIQRNCMEQPTIPHIVHYMWLTDPDNPREAPQNHLAYVTNSMEAFRNGTKYNDWSYQFHTNAPYAISNTSNFFISLGFQVRNIAFEYYEFQTGAFVDIFIKNKKYGMATDLARYEIVNHDGGIYLDLNFNLTRALDHEVCAYSYVNFNTNIGFQALDISSPENYFFISKLNHPILTQTISDIFNSFYGANSEAYWNNLNATNNDMTHGFFEIFSLNNVRNLTSNGEPGIIYSFSDERNTSQIEEDQDTFLLNENSELPEEYKNLIHKIEKVLKQKPSNFVCTSPDFAAPIGYDGKNGESWSNRKDSAYPIGTDSSYIINENLMAGELNEDTP